jgi:hypothetical protein
MTSIRHGIARVAILAGFILAGCSKSHTITAPSPSGTDPQSRSVVAARGGTAEGRRFVRRSDNPYFPLVPGTSFHYRSWTPDGIETEDVTVTRETKRIQGVRTIVVEDIVRLDGEVIERTLDWFAMDENGNVWYFGEDSRSIDPETGEVSTEGSWQAGVDGAEAGIIMKAHPRVGDTYYEENAPEVAEDQARVIALDVRAKVPYGRFDECLQTENFTDLEPGAVENKFYAPGVGLVLEIGADGKTRNELVRATRAGSGRSDDDEGRAWNDRRDGGRRRDRSD